MSKSLLLLFLLLLSPSNLYAECTSGDCRNGDGTNVWESGSNYSGFWKDGKMEGDGTYTWISGSRYTGQWKSGKKNGTGIYVWNNGDKYEGEWKDDQKSGKGTLIKVNGDTYMGQWKDDLKNGTGKYTWKNGDIYQGDWKNDHRSGNGTFTHASGDVYVGQWKKDAMHGTGKYDWANGDMYNGQWINGLRHGTGMQSTTLGDKFSGGWKKGKMEGYGIFVWHTGSVYAGNWKNNEMFGKGNFTTVKELNREKPGYLYNLFNPKTSPRKPSHIKTAKRKKPDPSQEQPRVVIQGNVKELPSETGDEKKESFLSSLERKLLGTEEMFQKREEELSRKIDVKNLEPSHSYRVTQRTPLLAERRRSGSVVKTVVYLKPGETFTVLRRKESKEVILYIVMFRKDNKGWINSRTLREKSLERVRSSLPLASP